MVCNQHNLFWDLSVQSVGEMCLHSLENEITAPSSFLSCVNHQRMLNNVTRLWPSCGQNGSVVAELGR